MFHATLPLVLYFAKNFFVKFIVKDFLDVSILNSSSGKISFKNLLKDKVFFFVILI